MGWVHLLIVGTALAGQTPASSPVDDRGQEAKPAAKAKESTPAKPDAAAKKPASPARPTAKATPGPRVMTRSEMQKPKSPFLSPPGSEGAAADRYAPGPTDWSDVPAWRQTSFFGVRAQGRFFVYVIDCSESMIDDDRFARATMEVRRSVLALQAPQQFEVIFFNEGSIPMPGGPMPRAADSRNKDQLVGWLRLVDPDGGTDPRSALRQAIALRPEAIFLLSDGEFPAGTVEAVSHFNAKRVPIHCVDLSGDGGEHLRRIARESGGQYAARPGSLQGKR